ncbi:hypothetical protein [Nocardioides acrostichi]|uniref:Uncharacterized protein n=1 Tax=Nocardioides acrostichi TaxID=2784339 RepID=A0A930Y5T0_9ACTN|nr:hypothetical protein [Nocardioides acrostichi]MBF4160206.1 hypothetical protein [Nocardioides acrostichi]
MLHDVLRAVRVAADQVGGAEEAVAPLRHELGERRVALAAPLAHAAHPPRPAPGCGLS